MRARFAKADEDDRLKELTTAGFLILEGRDPDEHSGIVEYEINEPKSEIELQVVNPQEEICKQGNLAEKLYHISFRRMWVTRRFT